MNSPFKISHNLTILWQDKVSSGCEISSSAILLKSNDISEFKIVDVCKNKQKNTFYIGKNNNLKAFLKIIKTCMLTFYVCNIFQNVNTKNPFLTWWMCLKRDFKMIFPFLYCGHSYMSHVQLICLMLISLSYMFV